MNVIICEFVNGELQIVIKGIKLLYNIVNAVFFGKQQSIVHISNIKLASVDEIDQVKNSYSLIKKVIGSKLCFEENFVERSKLCFLVPFFVTVVAGNHRNGAKDRPLKKRPLGGKQEIIRWEAGDHQVGSRNSAK